MSENRRDLMELKPGDTFDQEFVLRDRELRKTPAGATYVACLLSDKTGTVGARWWKANEEVFATIPERGFVRVKGRVESHRGQIQLIIDALDTLSTSEAEIESLLPETRRARAEMWSELVEILAEIDNKHLARLVEAFIDDEKLMARFRNAPAGAQLHHSQLGGLLEHTLSVVRLARAVALTYGDELNFDLLLTAAFLHDIGKADEIGVDGSYTDRGNLVGHIALGAIRVQEKAAEVEESTGQPFPQQTLDLVQHLIVSHHGTHAKGSPRLPMTAEAILLHSLDDLDARLDMVRNAVEKEVRSSASFTRYHRTLDVKVYKNSKDIP